MKLVYKNDSIELVNNKVINFASPKNIQGFKIRYTTTASLSDYPFKLDKLLNYINTKLYNNRDSQIKKLLLYFKIGKI